jgi:hypothetical protein
MNRQRIEELKERLEHTSTVKAEGLAERVIELCEAILEQPTQNLNEAPPVETQPVYAAVWTQEQADQLLNALAGIAYSLNQLCQIQINPDDFRAHYR